MNDASATQPPITLEELFEEFEHLPEWKDRCEFLIDLGFELPPFPEEARTEENKVRGCQSNVWMIAQVDHSTDPPRIYLMADSDAMIVRGLIAVILAMYSGKTPQEILSTDAQAVFERLGLSRHLSTARKNGLAGMVQRIRQLAAEALVEHDRRKGNGTTASPAADGDEKT